MYEQMTICGADGRANDFSTTGIVHRDQVEDIPVCCIDHGNFSSVVDYVNFSIRGKWRSLVFGTAILAVFSRAGSPCHKEGLSPPQAEEMR